MLQRAVKNNKISTRSWFFLNHLNLISITGLYNKIIPMKKIISALFMVGMGLAGDLKIGIKQKDQRQNANSYGLSCDGARGAVKYYVEGLPNGVTFVDATINISNFARPGSYTVRIKAIDQFGQSAERIITLSIAQTAGQVGNLGAQNGQAGQTGPGQQPDLGQNSGQPGGGQPGGGQPGSGPGQTGSPNNGASGRLNNILQNYSSNTQQTTFDYGNSGRYPEPNLQSNPDPNLINPFPAQIANDKSQPTPANRNPITSDDVALRAASERHQNAIKGITNLLKIIDQAKANKDKAQRDILTYTQAYNDAVAAQRSAQNDIISAETKVSQIVSAINSLTTTVDDLRSRINQIVTERDNLTREKQSILSNITTQQGKKADLLQQLKGLDNQVGQKVKDLSDKSAECQSLSNAVNNKAKQLGAAQQQLANSDALRATVVTDINNKSALVDDLRKQLQQAEKDLTDAKIRLADIDAKRLALPVQISNLRKELDDLQAKAKACADQVANLQAIIDNLKGDNYKGITKDINDLDNKIGTNRSRVSEIDAKLASSQGPLEDLKAKLNQANEDLGFLKVQKADADGALRIAYQRGNDANNRVAFAKQNIDAIIKRFQDESKIISDATLNLERARAEEALARLGLEQYIAHYSDALPYAIVPNGNGQTNAGTPNGNNPSGSPLGPIQNNGNGAPGSFKVNSWLNYLSSAYGAGVNPSFPGSVTELFPFNFLSTVSGNVAQGTNILNGYGNIRGQTGQAGQAGQAGQSGQTTITGGGCGGNNLNQKVATGVVVEVREDSFDIRADDGQIYGIKVAPCTRLNANIANYKMKKGHQAVVKGIAGFGKVKQIQGDQITCLQ